MELYYNEDGWLCDRLPLNIKRDKNSNICNVSNDDFLKTFSAPAHFAWKVVNNNLSLERFENDSLEQTLQNELLEIEKWFNYYDNQMIQYQRSQILGEIFDKDIVELNNEAKTKAKKLKDIKEELNGK